MTKCAVTGCREIGIHKFPKDQKIRKLWIKALRRKKASESLRLCRAHFKESDYETVKSTGFKYHRKILKKTAVPSIFPWSRKAPHYAAAMEERLQRRNSRKELFPPVDPSHSNIEIVKEACQEIEDLNVPEYCQEEVISSSDLYIETVKCDNGLSTTSTQTPILIKMFATEELVYNDKSVKFYTGLESYEKFNFVFSTLCPMAYNLKYKSSSVVSLSVEDQFLLTLIKLRSNKCDFELSLMFGVSQSTVSNIFVTWLNFMYDIWSLIDTWPKQDLVQFYMPESFDTYENTRIIIDTTEIPICKPGNPLSQQATFSTYKNKNTIKFLIGATPGGLISYCSDGYGGATSDRQIIERSSLLELCEPGDVIMADRGFNVQDIFAPKNVTIKIPTFLKGMSQLPGVVLSKDRKLASKRVHIERLIGLAKTYTILKSELNSYYVPLASKLFFICTMLCNFREKII